MTDAFWYNNMATALSLTKTDLQDKQLPNFGC